MTESSKPMYPEPQHFPEALELPEPLPEQAVIPQGSFGPPASAEPLPHVEHSYAPARLTCVRCGSTNLARGMIVDLSHKFDQVRFAPRRITLHWLNSIFNLRPFRSLLKLHAVACRDCGAVLMEIDPEELRRIERRRDY